MLRSGCKWPAVFGLQGLSSTYLESVSCLNYEYLLEHRDVASHSIPFHQYSKSGTRPKGGESQRSADNWGEASMF